MGTVFIYAAYTHKAGEALNAVLFPRQLLLCVELGFPTVKFPPLLKCTSSSLLKGASLVERRAKNGERRCSDRPPKEIAVAQRL